MKKIICFVFLLLFVVSTGYCSNESFIIKELNLELIKCPAGSFMMGSPESEHSRHKEEMNVYHEATYGFNYGEELHSVTIDKPFYIGKYEITQNQYRFIMGDNPSRFKGEINPVESVDWIKAKLFCIKLNYLYKNILPKGYNFDLPTEAQWEYACRAGTNTALNNGENMTSYEGACSNLDEVAWYSENASYTTHIVGQKKSNDWGIYDMHGNVWEWCKDTYKDYSEKHIRNRDRVVRGGSFFDSAIYCRSANRFNNFCSCCAFCLGFRVALVPIN